MDAVGVLVNGEDGQGFGLLEDLVAFFLRDDGVGVSDGGLGNFGLHVVAGEDPVFGVGDDAVHVVTLLLDAVRSQLLYGLLHMISHFSLPQLSFL